MSYIATEGPLKDWDWGLKLPLSPSVAHWGPANRPKRPLACLSTPHLGTMSHPSPGIACVTSHAMFKGVSDVRTPEGWTHCPKKFFFKHTIPGTFSVKKAEKLLNFQIQQLLPITFGSKCEEFLIALKASCSIQRLATALLGHCSTADSMC